MSTHTFFIEFKTKTFPVVDGETRRQAVNLKAKLERRDCNMSPQDHDYFNSDLFPAMLNGAYRLVVGTRTWVYLDALPEGMAVDTSKFLAVVRIPLARNFNPRRTL